MLIALLPALVASLLTSTFGLRATQLKRLLKNAGISTTGYFEKNELQKLAEERLVSSWELEPVDGGRYYGIRPFIQAQELLFMVDTGASANLVREMAVTRLGLHPFPLQVNSAGMNGITSLASQAVQLPFGGQAALLTSERATILPNEVVGLLGLGFLENISAKSRYVDFLFETKDGDSNSRRPTAVMRTGPPELLTETYSHNVQGSSYSATRRLQSGLLVTDNALIRRIESEREHGIDTETRITAMIDLGTTHTIANPMAAAALGVSIEGLPVSQTKV